MFRKILFALNLVVLLSFGAAAQTQPGSTTNSANCSGPVIKVNPTRLFNSQALGNGVEVTWTTERLLPCTNVKTLSVTVFLETAQGEKLTLRKEVSSAMTKAHLVVPASKVHIFTASDAKTKIRAVVAAVRRH